MKNLLKSSITTFAGILAVLLLVSGCSINDTNTTASEDLTEEELEVAGQIIAESLSDQKDGIFASLNDAFTLPSSNGFNQAVQASKIYSSAVFNAAANSESSESESNYSYTYNPESGKHLVSFSRSDNRPDFSKESSSDLEYIYLNSSGDFIASPRIENENIETIDYIGTRSGSIITPNQNSSYQREDQFMIQGLTGGSAVLSIDGLHNGSGSFKATRDDGTEIERDYELTVEFLEVEINNSTVESNGNLEKGVSGGLAYEMRITKTVNGKESLKTVNGTVEFNGDGTALLRFRNILDDFKIQLGDGDLLEDDEFNGFVRSVDNESNTFTLFNGQTYLLAGDTEFNTGSDLLGLEEVEATLENDIRVATSGRFIEDEAGTNLVRSVTFNYEREDVEFEENVESVDLENRSFTLTNGLLLFVNDETNIEEEEDGLNNIEAVHSALAAGNIIEADGEFDPAPDGTNIVNEVSFEYENQEFESSVEIVNIENSSFTLADGKTYITNANTDFEDDITSMEQLASVFENGLRIKAEGEYYLDSEGNRVVLEVEFESEDFDENEFEGVVEAVNTTERSFTLEGGLVFFVNSDTKYKDDIRSFNELATEFTNGERIEAEVEYYVDSSGSEDRNIVIKAEFELDDDDSGRDDNFEEKDFEDYVDSADPGSNTITLENGLVLLANENTEFDNSDIKSIGELHGAIESGLTAEAEGEYYTDEEGNNIIIEIDFELSGNRGNDDDDDDRIEKDFEDYVQSVDLNNNTFTLNSGLLLQVTGDTEFGDDDDVQSLIELANAIADGLEVEADGEYYTDTDGVNIVTEVEFDIEGNRDDDNDDDSDEREEKDFEDYVQSVDLNNNTFTLNSGLLLQVTGDTEFGDDDDVQSLTELANAIADGLEVEADGEYYTDADGINIVIEVEFDIEGNRDDDDDDDSDEREEKDFEDYVQSVDLNNSTFTLNNGLLLQVDGNTEFDDDDIRSLSELANAIDDGLEVEADGEYYTDADGINIVIEVEFDIEDKEFEGYVQSVDLNNDTFMLKDGLVLQVSDETEFDDDGDFYTLTELANAIDDGLEVEADGEYYTDADGKNIVVEVEFEVEVNDDDNDSDDSDENDDDEDDDDDDDDDDD